MQDNFKEYRCNNCNKLLFKGVIEEGVIEIKCRGCKEINTIEVDRDLEENIAEVNMEVSQ